MDIAFEDKVRQRAYESWMTSGMNEGDAEHHWLRAERAVRTEACGVEAKSKPSTIKKAARAPTEPAKAKAIETAAKTGAATRAPEVMVTKTSNTKTAATIKTAPRRTKVASVEAVA